MNRLTPAMEAGVADHVWSLEEMANWPPCSIGTVAAASRDAA
jgi:hypothetical protein